MKVHVLWVIPVLVFALSAQARAQQGELSLAEALGYGYQSNPSLAAAEASYKASQAKVGQALAGWMPSLNASLSYQRTGSKLPDSLTGGSGGASPFAGLDMTSVPAWGQAVVGVLEQSLAAQSRAVPSGWQSANKFGESLTLTQPIYDFGRTTGAHEAAKESVKSYKHDIQSARETVALSVISAYYAVLATEENQTAVAEIRQQMQKHLEQARAQYERGARTKIDVTRAESDLASAELSVVTAKNAVVTARVGLNNAMGRFDLGDYRLVPAGEDAGLPAQGKEELVSEAQGARADLAGMRAKLAAVRATRQTAIGGFLPVLSASAQYAAGGEKIDAQTQSWAVGVTLGWNLLGGLTAIHSLHEVDANTAALKANIASLENAVRVEVENALVAARNAREKIAPQEALLRSAKETLELAEARYSAGLGTIVDVTDAEAQYAQARVGLIQARLDLQTTRAKLYKAVGRLQQHATGS